MNKHAEGTNERLRIGLRVLDGQHRKAAVTRILEEYDATTLVGLKTVVRNAAVEHTDEDGDVTVELPNLNGLLATAAVKRCLTPTKLRGPEMRAMRRIMGFTLTDLASRLDEKTAVETISRWETEAQPMGGYAEKLLRLIVCEMLHEDAPGIEYSASIIADMRVLDPWRLDASYEMPALEFSLVRMKEQSGTIIEAWDTNRAA